MHVVLQLSCTTVSVACTAPVSDATNCVILLRYPTLTVRQLDYVWVMFTKLSSGKVWWKAHDIKVLLTIVYGVFFDNEQFVLLCVRILDNLLSKFWMVKAWKPWILSTVAFSSIVLLTILTVCLLQCLQHFVSTEVRQTVLLFVGFPFTIMNNSIFGKAMFTLLVCCTWSRVSSILFNGSGRIKKCCIPVSWCHEWPKYSI